MYSTCALLVYVLLLKALTLETAYRSTVFLATSQDLEVYTGLFVHDDQISRGGGAVG